MLRETTSRGLRGLVCPSRTIERGGDFVFEKKECGLLTGFPRTFDIQGGLQAGSLALCGRHLCSQACCVRARLPRCMRSRFPARGSRSQPRCLMHAGPARGLCCPAVLCFGGALEVLRMYAISGPQRKFFALCLCVLSVVTLLAALAECFCISRQGLSLRNGHAAASAAARGHTGRCRSGPVSVLLQASHVPRRLGA